MNKDFSFLELRKTIELHDFVIQTEKIENKTSFTRIFANNKVIVSASGIVWHKCDYMAYQKYFSECEFSLEEFSSLKEKDIRMILLSDIFKQVIKNNIMML